MPRSSIGTLVRCAGAESGPAFGAARLARLCVSGESSRAVWGEPEVLDAVSPDPEWVERYRAGGLRFRRLYRALAPEFRSGD